MFLFLLASFSQAIKVVCICNGQCHSNCSASSFNILSPNISFKDFIISQIKDEKEIILDFYSKQRKFNYSMDSHYFDNTKVILHAFSDSQPIFLNINEKSTQNYKKIEIKPNDKVILSDILSYQSPNRRHILDSSDTSTVPISVSLAKMKYSGSTNCFKSSGSTTYSISELTNMNDVGCTTNVQTAFQCGVRCYSSDMNFEYTFKGVKFAVYGTKDPGHGKFDIFLDGNHLIEVNEYKSTREAYTVLYTSDLLQYREHVVKLQAKGETYELYKLVYWPSIRAKRMNCTDFQKTGWQAESDGIDGIREYKSSNPTATISLYCSRFWFYGLKDDNMGDITIQYGNVTEVVNQYSAQRIEGAIIYESPILNRFQITIHFSSPKTIMISYLYYEEPPIPMSVGVIQMNYKNIQGCGFYTKDGTVNPDNAKNDRSLIGCPTTDLDKESAYKCGLKCWGSNTEYYYTFKGVKFAIYGTIDTGHYDFDVKLNGVTIDVAHENGQKKRSSYCLRIRCFKLW